MNRPSNFPFLPKDFIETAEGLVFAVVSYGSQDGKVGCFLRYVQAEQGWQKVSTEQANDLLTQHYPDYLYYSEQLDAHFHAVAPEKVRVHHRPEQRLQALLAESSDDVIINKLQRLIVLLSEYGVETVNLGVTGSLLLGCQKGTSDIDLAIYGLDAFHQTRDAVKRAIAEGQLAELDEELMRDNFDRRQGELSYQDFAWHEQRKFNKAVIDSTKFDIAVVNLDHVDIDNSQFKKQGHLTITANVTDDSLAYDSPARYQIAHEQISEVIVFTQTYVGQAERGELIEAAGAVEQNVTTGRQRLVVGSTREAFGEYLRVVNNNQVN